MTHFAKIDDNNIVIAVMVIEQDKIDTGHWGNPDKFIQTSYNTHKGVHSKGGTPLRKNYAGIGYTYDVNRDAFIPPKPHNSFILNEEKGIYEPPTPYPNDGKKYDWDEPLVNWKVKKIPEV